MRDAPFVAIRANAKVMRPAIVWDLAGDDHLRISGPVTDITVIARNEPPRPGIQDTGISHGSIPHVRVAAAAVRCAW